MKPHNSCKLWHITLFFDDDVARGPKSLHNFIFRFRTLLRILRAFLSPPPEKDCNFRFQHSGAGPKWKMVKWSHKVCLDLSKTTEQNLTVWTCTGQPFTFASCIYRCISFQSLRRIGEVKTRKHTSPTWKPCHSEPLYKCLHYHLFFLLDRGEAGGFGEEPRDDGVLRPLTYMVGERVLGRDARPFTAAKSLSDLPCGWPMPLSTDLCSFWKKWNTKMLSPLHAVQVFRKRLSCKIIFQGLRNVLVFVPPNKPRLLDQKHPEKFSLLTLNGECVVSCREVHSRGIRRNTWCWEGNLVKMKSSGSFFICADFITV